MSAVCPAPAPELLTEEEGRCATRLARGSLIHAVTGKKEADPDLTPAFSGKRGVFVTLTKRGELRGCIGFPYPTLPLAQAIRQAAVAAALEDPRFSQVQENELPFLELEVTILTVPQPLTVDPAERPSAVVVGKHGLIVRGMGGGGLLLPQVAPEWGWDSTEFLDHTCLKAGLPSGCWKKSAVEVMTFEGQIFHLDRL
ncbi:MAG TPA: TIGR00296 family protein [Methanoregulaceae archaeon]|nr:TIGR00296 family protein [Methanoregulaceae archaeon]HPD74731.1 TIGR00296 family protein [Methanoregulaceae archaeon]HRY74706.1 TIGR00296 family protein [Methanoregulaceae archaeon]